MKQIGVSVSDDLKAKLAELAKEKERSVSWVAREILEEYFKERTDD
jgi:predicted transcriptional regulator